MYWDPIKAAGTPLPSNLGACVITETDGEEVAKDTRSKWAHIKARMM